MLGIANSKAVDMTMFGYNRDELTSTLPDGGSISFTDGFPDGTLVEPGVYFTNDTDSGLVRNGPIGGPSIIGVVLDGVTSTVFTADGMIVEGDITLSGNLKMNTGASDLDLLQSDATGNFIPKSIQETFQSGANANSIGLAGTAAVGSTSIGVGSVCDYSNSVALGFNALSNCQNSIVVGAASSTSAGSTTCMVLGNNSQITGFAERSIIIGHSASSGNNNVTAIGHSTVTASTSVAIGDSASAGSLGVSIGANTQTGSRSLALGVSSNCAGTDTVSVGYANNNTTLSGCTVIGSQTSATSANQLVIGVGGSGGNRLASTLNVSTVAATTLEGYLDVTINGVDYKIPLMI